MEKKFSKTDIYEIIDLEIKNQMNLKNAYIVKNGYKNTDILNRFDTVISTLSSLYGKFK